MHSNRIFMLYVEQPRKAALNSYLDNQYRKPMKRQLFKKGTSFLCSWIPEGWDWEQWLLNEWTSNGRIVSPVISIGSSLTKHITSSLLARGVRVLVLGHLDDSVTWAVQSDDYNWDWKSKTDQCAFKLWSQRQIWDKMKVWISLECLSYHSEKYFKQHFFLTAS